ncbi:MAG TPA: hypothetical protein EYF98_00215 [Planctomycetes bacterium]|nr:hypothetical protein [Planctomycetota bacterium]
MSSPPHLHDPDSKEEPAAAQPELIPLRTLMAVNLRVLLVVAALGAMAFGLWRGLAALFPELKWLQYPG